MSAADVVRRMLLAMGERELLERFDGFLLGRIKARSHLVDRSEADREAYRERVRETVLEVVSRYNPTAPIVLGVDFGHTNPTVPVPIGGTAAIDPDSGRIGFG